MSYRRSIRFTGTAAGPMASTTPYFQNPTGTLFWEFMEGEEKFSVHTTIGGVNVITVQASNDGTNWFNQAGKALGTGGATTATITADGITVYDVEARFYRLNITTYASGTVTASVQFSTVD